jgi:hypothetical protein
MRPATYDDVAFFSYLAVALLHDTQWVAGVFLALALIIRVPYWVNILRNSR